MPACPPATTPLTSTLAQGLGPGTILQSPLSGSSPGGAFQTLTLAASQVTLWNPVTSTVTVHCITNALAFPSAGGAGAVALQSVGFAAYPSVPLPLSTGCNVGGYPEAWLGLAFNSNTAAYGVNNFTSTSSPFPTSPAAVPPPAFAPPATSNAWTIARIPPVYCPPTGIIGGGAPQIPASLLGYGFVSPGSSPPPGYSPGDLVAFNTTGVWRFQGAMAPTTRAGSSGMLGFTSQCLKSAAAGANNYTVLAFGGGYATTECWYVLPRGTFQGMLVALIYPGPPGSSGGACRPAPEGPPPATLTLSNFLSDLNAPGASPSPSPAPPSPTVSPQPTPGITPFCPTLDAASGAALADSLRGASSLVPHSFATDLPSEPTLTSFTGGSAPGSGLSFKSARGPAQSLCASSVRSYPGVPNAFVIQMEQQMIYGCLKLSIINCVFVVKDASGSGIVASEVRRGGVPHLRSFPPKHTRTHSHPA